MQSRADEIETAFVKLRQQHAGALLVGGDGLLNFTHRDHIVALAASYAIPAIYVVRETVLAGGLVSYGLDQFDAWRQAGVYTGRILRGERPTDLPVQRVTKLALLINLKTARALSLEVPPTLPRRRGDRVRADLGAIAHGRLWHGAADSECPLFGR